MALGWRGQYYRYKDFFLNVMSLYKRRADLRAFLEIILSVSAVTIFFAFALKPTAITMVSLYNEIKEKENTVSLLDQKVNNLQKASDVFIQNEGAVSNIDTSVATNPQPDAIAKQIQGIALKNSVNVLGISVGQVTVVGTAPEKKSSPEFKTLPENAKGMPLSISVSGGYTNLISFIKDFENLRIVTMADALGINASTTADGRVIVAVISGRVPFLGQ